MAEQYDILEVLGISDREDSFTNFIVYLFYNNNDFRYKFSEKFFGIKKKSDLGDIELKVRNKFIMDEGKHIAPDLILYSKTLKKIAVIEVKVFSGPGENQLSDYENGKDVIKNDLKMDVNSSIRFYYLSLYNAVEKHENWTYVSWSTLYEIFSVKDSREDINILIKTVHNRIESISKKLSYENIKNDSFGSYLKWTLWKSPAAKLKDLVLSNVAFVSKIIGLNIDSYSGFAPAENCVQTNLYFWKNEWKSDIECTDNKSNVTNCYDFHIEIRITVNDSNLELTFRLDHHLNPYKPDKEMKSCSNYNELYEGRKKFISHIKYGNSECFSKDGGYEYNRAAGNYLYLVKKVVQVDNNKSVAHVLDLILNEVKYLVPKIDAIKNELMSF